MVAAGVVARTSAAMIRPPRKPAPTTRYLPPVAGACDRRMPGQSTSRCESLGVGSPAAAEKGKNESQRGIRNKERGIRIEERGGGEEGASDPPQDWVTSAERGVWLHCWVGGAGLGELCKILYILGQLVVEDFPTMMALSRPPLPTPSRR